MSVDPRKKKSMIGTMLDFLRIAISGRRIFLSSMYGIVKGYLLISVLIILVKNGDST